MKIKYNLCTYRYIPTSKRKYDYTFKAAYNIMMFFFWDFIYIWYAYNYVYTNNKGTYVQKGLFALIIYEFTL